MVSNGKIGWSQWPRGQGDDASESEDESTAVSSGRGRLDDDV